LRKSFFDDIQEAEQIDPKVWANRSKWNQLPEKLSRLLSPLL